jgi:hypothetical protein
VVHPPNPCHPERNIVIGEADDNVESKDPMPVEITNRHVREFSPFDLDLFTRIPT